MKSPRLCWGDFICGQSPIALVSPVGLVMDVASGASSALRRFYGLPLAMGLLLFSP